MFLQTASCAAIRFTAVSNAAVSLAKTLLKPAKPPSRRRSSLLPVQTQLRLQASDRHIDLEFSDGIRCGRRARAARHSLAILEKELHFDAGQLNDVMIVELVRLSI